MRNTFTIIFFCLFWVGEACGQAIFSNPITGTNPNTSNPYTTGQTVAANITASGIGRGTGITGTNANDRYNANGWSTSTLATNDYFEFVITPSAGYKIDFTSFVYTSQISSGTASHSFRSSLDSYTASIGTPTTTGTTISLSGAAYQGITSAITFRFYTYGVAASTTTFSLNDFTFNGTISTVSTYTATLTNSATLAEPSTISPLATAFSGATGSQQNAVANFDFNIVNSDAAPIQFSQLILNAGTGNGVTAWSDAIQEASLTDGTNTVTTTTIAANNLTFASLPTSAGNIGYVGNGTTKTYTLTIRFKTALSGTAPTTIDGQDFVFLVNNSSFTFAAGNLATGQTVNSGDGNNTVAVVASSLTFVTQPATTVINQTMTSPTVQASDANGNRDLGYGTIISIVSTGTLDSSPKTATPTSGLATFNNVVHTAAGTNFTLTATSGSLAGATSSNFDILTAPCLSESWATNALPTGWTQSSVTFTSNYAEFAASTGTLATGALAYPSTLTFDLMRTTNTTAKTLFVEVSVTSQSAGFVTVATYDHSNTTSGGTTACTINLASYSTYPSVYVRFRKNSSTTSPWRLDNVNVYCASVTCGHTITSFAPTSAPVGAWVTIQGTGFSASSTVSFNGTAASGITFIDATKILAQVPNAATTGVITVVEGCSLATASNFTITNTVGSCANASLTDLFISEVYDAAAGNVLYVELYNPTNASINLATSNYVLKIDNRAASDAGVTIDRTITLTGTVPANSVFLVNLGNSANTCTNSWGFTETGAGINELDYLFLEKNGTDVDRADFPDEVGYTYTRKPNAVAPSTSYNAADWNISSSESCSDLGAFSPGAPPTVSNITDASACNLSMSVSATAGAGGSLAYKWYYHDGAAATWSIVNTTNLPAYTLVGETSNNLQITSGAQSVTTLSGYQFYCEVSESGSCSKQSNATLFNSSTRPVYRSVASANGNWTTIANWEMANSTAGAWVSACMYPTASNSTEVIIQSGSTIVLDADLAIDRVTVENNATLEIAPNSMLTLNNNFTGADLIVNGTWIYRANSSNTLAFNSSATWSLASNATIIKTNTASGADLRDNYEGGISTIPATAQFTARYNGDGNITLSTVGMYYPNLTIESTAGFWDASATASKFLGTSNFATIKGNLDIGGAGTGTVKVYNENQHSQLMLILGNLTVRAGSTLTNDGTDKGTGFEVRGNLAIEGTFYNAATDATTTHPVLRLNDTAANQSISGAGTLTLHELEINKSGFEVILMRHISADYLVELITGDLNLNGFNLDLGTTGTLSESLAADALVKDETATTEANQGGYVRLTNRNISNAQTNIGGSRLSLHWTTGADYTVNIDRYHYRASYGKAIALIYAVSVHTGTMGTTNLRISYADMEALGTIEPLNVARWSAVSSWESFVPDDYNATANYSQRNGVTQFSHWTLSDLNIMLSSVRAQARQVGEQASRIEWQGDWAKVAILKSHNGRDFEHLAYPEAKTWTDNYFTADAYYRLQNLQTGEMSAVIFLARQSNETVKISPNPLRTGEVLQVRLPAGEEIRRLQWTDAQGKTWQMLDLPALREALQRAPKGLYILQIYTNKGSYLRKLVKE